MLAVGQLRLLCASQREMQEKPQKEVEGEQEQQTTLMHLSLESYAHSTHFHHLSVFNGRVNKAHYCTAGDKPPSLPAVSDRFSSPPSGL